MIAILLYEWIIRPVLGLIEVRVQFYKHADDAIRGGSGLVRIIGIIRVLFFTISIKTKLIRL